MTYAANDIFEFLKSHGYGFGANSWKGEKGDGRVSDADARKWFDDYFPKERADEMYREMQASCTCHMDIQ